MTGVGEIILSPEQRTIRTMFAVALANVEAWQIGPCPPEFERQPVPREVVRWDGRWLRVKP
jgi:hypothetical protein